MEYKQISSSYKEFKSLKEENIDTNFIEEIEASFLQGNISKNEADLMIQKRAEEINSICKKFLNQFIS